MSRCIPRPPRPPTFFTWRSEREVKLPLRALGTTEAWTWLSRGSKRDDPAGVLFVPFGSSTRAHWHAPREDFLLLRGRAVARVESGKSGKSGKSGMSAWRRMGKKKVIVREGRVHAFRATSRDGAWLLFRFTGYRRPWRSIRYHFVK